MHHQYLPIINLSPLTFSAASRKILKMKRLFNPRKKSECEPQGQEPGSTLDRIVKDKEGVKKRLEEEEKSFMNKKREYERKMIEFEKQVRGWNAISEWGGMGHLFAKFNCGGD